MRQALLERAEQPPRANKKREKVRARENTKTLQKGQTALKQVQHTTMSSMLMFRDLCCVAKNFSEF